MRIAFGDREVVTKVVDLPDTEEYKTEKGNYIDLATYHKEFTIASALPLYMEKDPVWWATAKKKRFIMN